MTDSYPQQFYTENGQLYVRANDVDAPKKSTSRRSTSKFSIEDLKRQSRIQSVSANQIDLQINQPLLKAEKSKQKKLNSEARSEKSALALEELKKTPLLWADHLITSCARDISQVKKQEAKQAKVNDNTLVMDEDKKNVLLNFMKGLPKRKLDIATNYQNAMAYITTSLTPELQTELWTTLQKRNAHAKSIDELVCISDYDRKIKSLGEQALLRLESEPAPTEAVVETPHVEVVQEAVAVPENVQEPVPENIAVEQTASVVVAENADN